MNTLEREALSLATNEFEVFPVAPGDKAPPLVKFTQTATSDPVIVAEFWREYPRANIGVRPGGGTLIVDTDSQQAEQVVGELALPETTSVRTPRGGRHLYFKGSAPTRAGVRPGLDVRGKGGYALGPGSIIGDGRYQWIAPPWEIPPQRAPRQLLELVTESIRRREQFGNAPILRGCRNTRLTQIAGSFVRYGISGEGLRAALHVVNRERCKPPLSEQEVEKIIVSASKWDIPPGWVLDPIGFAEDPRLDSKARHVLAILAARASHDGMVRGGEWLSQVTGLSRHSIYRAVGDLEEHGRIRVERSPKAPNRYQLLLPDDAPWVRQQLALSGTCVATCDMVGVDGG